ncbi:hypothetical protein HPB47_005407 [Ixodes persulcatus]|uniref:Uncharacterized protein n=1 Tax=Ixodes persulcatus TaxID=34615 RepID=A0AC60PDQ0_IXOPE|nr:hypothetical protein HPB47_005407 [Ixodes persulcatus]
MLDALDESIGRVVEALDNAGILEDTIIVFSSDNGGAPYGLQSNRAYNWPLRGAKFTLWEGSVRVPAFVWSPKFLKKSRVSNQLMHISDWLPTLYTAAESLNPDGAVVQLWLVQRLKPKKPRRMRKPPDLKEKQHPSWSPLTWSENVAVDCRRDRLTDNFVPTEPPYLFNIEEDPCELNNLAKTQRNTLRFLMKKLDAYNATAVPALFQPEDPRAYPEYHGGIWSPWLD